MRQPAETFPGRKFYQSKGVDWASFVLWLIPAFAVAALLAEGMAQLFILGHYLIFIVPLVTGLCVAGMINLAVNKGHCRNAIVGGLAGLLAGLVMYLGHFYFGMVHDFGPESASHPEALPTYIRLRMATEVTHDVGAPQNDDERKMPNKGDVVMNWVRFGLEFAFVLGITTIAGVKRSRKPYCEACRRWMVRELTPYDPSQTTQLLEALRTRSARSLAVLSAQAPFATIPNVTLAVDYCPTLKDGAPRDCPVYLSVKEIRLAPKAATRDLFEQSKGKPLVRGLQAERDELAALAPRFKVLETIAGRTAINALLPEEEPAVAEPAKDLTYADIGPLPQDHCGKIMTRKTIITAAVMSFGILFSLFASLGLLIWGLIVAFPDHPPVEGISPGERTFGTTLMVIGGLWLLVTLVIGIMDPSHFGNRYVQKQLRREFARRTSLLVDPHDPEALFVEAVPKMNWGKMMLENASDVGLMVVDRSKREIRFEGDKERWRISAAAITYCQFEVFVHQQGNAKTKIFYTVLRANHRDGFWEAPLRPRGSLGLFSKKRKQATYKLYESIQAIRGQETVPMA